MVRATKGVLLTCDPAVKQIILNLDERKKFIIQDLDMEHILVSADMVEEIKQELEAELEKNTFSLGVGEG